MSEHEGVSCWDVILWTGMLICIVVLAVEFCGATEDTRKQDIIDYVEDFNENRDGERWANAAYDVGYVQFGQDPWYWTFIARYESGFDTTATNPTSFAYGWIQFMPFHKQKVKSYGLDWYSPEDLFYYGCLKVEVDRKKGESYYDCYSAWVARKAAMKDYKKMFGCEPTFEERE